MQKSVVVENVVAVDTAVVDLVLEEPQKEVIPHRVFANGRLRSGDKEDQLLGCVSGVSLDPVASFVVPIFNRVPDGIAEFRVVVEAQTGGFVCGGYEAGERYRSDED